MRARAFQVALATTAVAAILAPAVGVQLRRRQLTTQVIREPGVNTGGVG